MAQVHKKIEINSTNINNIGSILSALRTNIPGMTQGLVADNMEVAQAHVSLMESNTRIPLLPSLINYLDVVGYRIVFEKVEI